MSSCFICILLLCGVASGCARGRLFKATNLPPEYLTARRENAKTINLSKLASQSPPSNLIDRGDVLDITIETGYGATRPNTSPVRVADDGTAMVPLVGRVSLAGLELEGAEQVVAAAGVERGVFRNPSVTVVMKRQRTNKITVIGAVEAEGVYQLPRGSCDLLSALVAAKGLSKEAGTDVEIRRANFAKVDHPAGPPPGDRTARTPAELTAFTRGQRPAGPSSMRINLVSAAQQANGGYWLEDGDVVMVEKRDPQPIHVMGVVVKPGEFELPVNRDLHLLDAIALAGGPSSSVADKVHVIRQIPGEAEPVVIDVSLAEAKRQGKGNLRLAPGDVVSVEQTPMTALVDTLKNFVRIGLGASVGLF